MLDQSEDFNKLPVPEKSIFMKLANEFQTTTEYLFLNPEELELTTGIGTRKQWEDLLKRQETISYLKGSMAFLSQIAQRKSFASLVQMALTGNQQAAKQVQELSGIMNQQDSNRVIILHKIPRAEEVK